MYYYTNTLDHRCTNPSPKEIAMSYLTHSAPSPRRVVVPAASSASVRNARPAREFGTGYGNSSGYASPRRYVRETGAARFRFA